MAFNEKQRRVLLSVRGLRWYKDSSDRVRVDGTSGSGQFVRFCPLQAAIAVATKRVVYRQSWLRPWDMETLGLNRDEIFGIMVAADTAFVPYTVNRAELLALIDYKGEQR